MGFFHVANCYFLVGGTLDFHHYFSKFIKVLPDGEFAELQKMLTAKAYFPMTLWKERKALFTLGGIKKYGSDLKEVEEYSISSNNGKHIRNSQKLSIAHQLWFQVA